MRMIREKNYVCLFFRPSPRYDGTDCRGEWLAVSLISIMPKTENLSHCPVAYSQRWFLAPNVCPFFRFLRASATSRLLLHKNIHDKVVAKILERAGRVSVGDPLREDGNVGEGATCMGPLVSGPQRDKVLGFISRVRETPVPE